MEKAMRWAIVCAEEAAEPVLTAFVLPMWNDKGSSYARWLSHQTVQAIAASDRSKFKRHAPRHRADEQDQWCTPKRNVCFLIVANIGWTVTVCATRQVEQRICLCTSAWEPTAKAKTAEDDYQQTISMAGLCPPNHCSKTTSTQPQRRHLKSSRTVKISATFLTKPNSNSAITRSCTRIEAGRKPHT